MYRDQEFTILKRRVYLQTGLAMIVIFAVMLNIAGLFTGTIFYNEFCVLNTRFGLERFNRLHIQLERGKKTKGWQDVAINSRLGYQLKGTYLPASSPSDKTVIFVHGISGSRLMGLWYNSLYTNAGYNVLLYDSRAHGESGGPSATWGYYEKYDLDQWVDWVKERQPNGIIGIHGVSMGAATALEHAALNESAKRVNFYIADSAYADLEDLLIQQVDATVNLHNPLWVKTLLKYSSAAAYIDSGFRYNQVSPIRSVSTVTTPILYLHGEADPLVSVAMCRQLYNSTKGYREIYTFPNVGHAMAIFDRKNEYRLYVQSFIQTALSQEKQIKK